MGIDLIRIVLFAFSSFLWRTAHLDLNLDIAFALLLAVSVSVVAAAI